MATCTHTDQITILEPVTDVEGCEEWSCCVIDEVMFRVRPEAPR